VSNFIEGVSGGECDPRLVGAKRCFVCEARRLDDPMNFYLGSKRSNRLVWTVLFNGFVGGTSVPAVYMANRGNALEVAVQFFVSGSFGMLLLIIVIFKAFALI
jgi:hypothetical protein